MTSNREANTMKMFFAIGMTTMLLSAAGCKSTSNPGLSSERTDETTSAIRKVVDDPTRMASMLAVTDAFESDIKTIEASIHEIRQEIVAANADYNTERATLEAMYVKLGNQARALGNVFRDRNFELRALSSSAEWEKIAGSNTSLTKFAF